MKTRIPYPVPHSLYLVHGESEASLCPMTALGSAVEAGVETGREKACSREDFMAKGRWL